MKKTLYIMAALLLSFSLAACKGAKEPAGERTSVGYVMENSTLTQSVYASVYPVDESISIIQFDVVNTPVGEEFPESMTYALDFVKQSNGDFLFTDTDQNGDSVSLSASFLKDGGLMISGEEFLTDVIGVYDATPEVCDVADVTVLYFLRNVPATGIGDFAVYSPMDEIVNYIAGDWFIYSNLYSEGEFMYSFLVAKDFSVIIDMSIPGGEVIYGSLDNTLNATHTYDVYNEDNELVTIEEALVSPVVYNGTTMTEGSTEEVFLAAPYDLTRSISISSDNTDVVVSDGFAITAVAPGTAKLTVTADYCGVVKDYELNIEVVPFEELGDPEDSADAEYNNPKYLTYFDKVSMRATMDVCFEDGYISVDILWADDAYTEHHWSYVGLDAADEGVYHLNGRYTIDTYTDDGFFSEEVIANNIDATLTLCDDGCYYWYDYNEDTDHECIFELPEF